jgi:hypothetical protein
LLSLKILLQKESWVVKKRKEKKRKRKEKEKKKREKKYKSNPSSLKSFQFLKERYIFKEQE